MSLDLDALTARFKRAGAVANATPDGASPQVRAFPAGPAVANATPEAPWLTAEAHLPVTGRGPTVESNTAGEGGNADHGRPLPPRRTGARGPKRRRWALPGSPAERRAEPVDPPSARFKCFACGKAHQPLPMPTGASALYSRTLDPLADPYSSRPLPLSRAGPVHDLALIRDSFSPWRGSPAEPPPTPTPTVRERFAHLWSGDAADQPTRPEPAPPPAPAPDPPAPARGVRLTLLDVIRRLGEKPPWA